MITDKESIADLEWLFYESESALGIQSNFSSLIHALKFSTAHQKEFDRQAFNEAIQVQSRGYDLLKAIGRERNIHRIYQKLSKRTQIILEAYYADGQFDAVVSRDFGPGIGLIPYTAAGKELSRIALQDSEGANQALRNAYKKLRIVLKKQVQDMHTKAVEEYTALANGDK